MAEGHNTDSNLNCTICLSYYTEPRLLPCYHVFCTPCLEQLITDSDDMVCPLCRTIVEIPDGRIKGFELYPFKTAFQNKEPNEHGGCQLCSEECFATAKCLECQMNLCSKCHDYHGKIKALQCHTLELLHNLNQDRILKDGSKMKNDCSEHKLELSQFCKTCNKRICTNCLEKYHQSHKTETLISSAKLKRDILFTRIASLKSRIPIIENTIEVVKARDNNSYKSCNQVKREMQSHAAGLKEVFCRMIDVLLKENVDRADDFNKRNLKCIRTYIDELENEKLSLLSITRTVENLISIYSNQDILQHFLDIGKNLDNVLEKEVKEMAEINDFRYQCGIFDDNVVKLLFGEIKNSVVPGGILPIFRSFPVPPLRPKAQMIHSFEMKSNVLGMVPLEDDSVWILISDALSLHKSNGTLLASEDPLEPDVQLLLRKPQNEIWFWTGVDAINKTTEAVGFNVPFKGGKNCCFIHNGNLIVFNPDDKILYEVTEKNGIVRKIGNTSLQNCLTLDNMYMTETQNLYLVITQENRILIIDHEGTIMHEKTYTKCKFSSVCTDNYGHIIAGDVSTPRVCVFSEQAIFLYWLLTKKENGITCPQNAIIDKLGNLWLTDHRKTVEIYSYL